MKRRFPDGLPCPFPQVLEAIVCVLLLARSLPTQFEYGLDHFDTPTHRFVYNHTFGRFTKPLPYVHTPIPINIAGIINLLINVHAHQVAP